MNLKSVWWAEGGIANEVDIVSPDQALNSAKEIALNARGYPTMFEIWDPENGLAFAIGLGQEKTVLTYQDSLEPPYFTSLGDVRASDSPFFCYGGEVSDYPAQNVVDIEVGFEALVQFLTLFDKPSCVDWEQL